MEEKPYLYIFRISHSYADIGNLRSKIPANEQCESDITRDWVEIFRYLKCVDNLSPSFFAGIYVYQDGLPNISQEKVDKTVDETRSANYQILRWLKEKGAVVLGTEDFKLLKEDYQASQVAGYPDREEDLIRLNQRDKFIAQRIKETLPEGKKGILFIGRKHDVSPLLDREIQVLQPTLLVGEALRELHNFGKERK
ncbi:hypothetical protein C4559_02820 [Candidatus Microgenomates bacterium]|nr:MAG: hypothetical protein C4559_02820 [Candidatus Microgenomates bacterium]